jgi:predicted esterase
MRSILCLSLVLFLLPGPGPGQNQQVPNLDELISRYEKFNALLGAQAAESSRLDQIRLKQEAAFRAGNVPSLIEALSEGIVQLERRPWNDKVKFAMSLSLQISARVVEPNQDVQVTLEKLFPVDERKAFPARPTVTISVVESDAGERPPPSATSPRAPRSSVLARRIPLAGASTIVNKRLLLPDGSYRVVATVESGNEVVAELRKPIQALSDYTERLERLAGWLIELKSSQDPKVRSASRELATLEYQAKLLAEIDSSPASDLDVFRELANLENRLLGIAKGADPLADARGDLLKAFRAPDGRLVPYRIYLPRQLNPTKALPIVVLLHDSLGDENSYFSDLYNGRLIKEEAERRGILLVAPSAGGRFPSYTGASEQDVLGVIAAVAADYRTDPNRLYLTGHSAGAAGAWLIASSRPDLFAAIAPVAGGSLPREALTMLLGKLANIPAMVVRGAKDGITPAAAPREIVAAAGKAGMRIEYYEAPAADHFTVVPKSIAQVLDFFDKHTRPEKPETSK